MKLNLTNKHALVGGATGGIGKASALELASLGARVTLLARNEEKLTQCLSALPKTQNQVHDFIAADFVDGAKVAEKVRQHMEKNAINYHILVNNTGGPPGGPITEAAADEFRRAFEMHLITAQLLSQALIPGMRKARYGRIINVISTSVKIPLPGLGVSNTIRGAMANWAKTMANELAADSITVNNVLPGATRTKRLEQIITSKARAEGKSMEEISESMETIIPMKRFASAEEIACAIAFLASPAASYITGINLPVDGGRTGCL